MNARLPTAGPGLSDGRSRAQIAALLQVSGQLRCRVPINQPERAFDPRGPGSRHLHRARPSSAIFAAAALSAPLTTNHTSYDRLITGKVRLIRSGGGFGEARTAITAPSAYEDGCSGKIDATWPSGPMPSRQMSKTVSSSLARTRRRPGRDRGRRHLPASRGSGPGSAPAVPRADQGPAWRCAQHHQRAQTFVAPPARLETSRRRSSVLRSESLVGPRGDPPTGERELGIRKSR